VHLRRLLARMQPQYDSWDYEPPANQGDQWGGSAPSSGPVSGGFEDPNVAVAFGLVDIGKGKGKGKASSWDVGAKADFPPHPPSLAGKGGTGPGMQTFGKGGCPGKAAGGGGCCPGGKGDVPQPGFSYKGKLAPRKAGFEPRPPPTMPPTSKPGGYTPLPAAPCDGSSKAPAPQQLPPPSTAALHMRPKGCGFTQPGKGADLVRTQMPPNMIPHDGRGPPVRTAQQVAPRFPGGACKGAHKGGPPVDPRAAAAGLGNALAAVAARGGASLPVYRPAPPHNSRYVPPGARPAHLLGQALAKLPPNSSLLPIASAAGFTPAGQPPPGGLAPELAALVPAGEGDLYALAAAKGAAPTVEKKPRIYLLVARLPPELHEGQLQQIIEQCGEVQAFRRGRDATGAPLSFGFAQFGDPEAAWKAMTCLSKRVLCGHEIKVMVEESAETLLQQWRQSQRTALRVNSDEELDWELERKAVSCKASIDAKVEELFGPPADGTLGDGAIAQRRQELREKERARIERMRKRKAWRSEAYAREASKLEVVEKRRRLEEKEKDDVDREKERAERKEKEELDEEELKLSKAEDSFTGVRSKVVGTHGQHADNRRLIDMVHSVQAEPREDLFRMELNLPYLRGERVLERKLRPWLERKVDFCMGGPQSDLVEFILRRINASSMPDALISELTRYLDDSAEPLVERMWRMLAFELMRSGVALLPSQQKAIEEQKAKEEVQKQHSI